MPETGTSSLLEYADAAPERIGSPDGIASYAAPVVPAARPAYVAPYYSSPALQRSFASPLTALERVSATGLQWFNAIAGNNFARSALGAETEVRLAALNATRGNLRPLNPLLGAYAPQVGGGGGGGAGALLGDLAPYAIPAVLIMVLLKAIN